MTRRFVAEWAMAIRGAIENSVRRDFPLEARRWPLLQGYSFQGYTLAHEYMVIVLRDELYGTPVYWEPEPFPYSDHPELPPKVEDVDLWQVYLGDKFDLREEDAAFVIPIRDSGQPSAEADYELFSAEEKHFFNRQIGYVIARQAAHLHIRNGDAAVEEWLPPAIRESFLEFTNDHPDPTKVAFILMQFDRTEAHRKITEAIKDGLAAHGITGVRADDKEYHEDLFPNVQTYLHGCGLGVAVFERIEAEKFNPNVSLEVGYMFAMDKRVCLLKDRTLPTLQSDLVGKLYREFEPQDPSGTIPSVLSAWLTDRGLSKS